MRKRERLERAVAGASVDRLPVSLWRHFPGDDQRSADLARSIVSFQREYDWDFVRVMPSNNFLVADYGIQDGWLGDRRGKRETQKFIIQRSLDWTEIRPLSPERGALAKHIQCMSLVNSDIGGDGIPVLQTIYSPMTQAAQIAGCARLLRDMRLRPDRLRSGLNALTESTLRFLEAIRTNPSIAGVFMVASLANYQLMSAFEYKAMAMPFNRAILDFIQPDWWLNAVQVQGPSPMYDLFAGAPVQLLNWDFSHDKSELLQMKLAFPGAVCGGLSDWEHLHQSTPALLQSAIRDILHHTEGQRLILAGSGDGFVTAPLSNLRAVRASVEKLAV
ncbi:MAG: hypothetical protein OXE52_17015 [Chloroflexi bacterium]|nr:hypothetical protein [Chloroflexota bacterium]